MGCAGNCCRKLFLTLLNLFHIGLCIAIICIVAIHLSDWTFNITEFDYSESTCILGLDAHGNSLCIYSYVVAGVSLAVAIALFLLLWITCNCCGAGAIIQFIISACGIAWWIVSSLVQTRYGAPSNEETTCLGDDDTWCFSYPAVNWRNSIMVMNWVVFAIFCIMTFTYAIEVFVQCCSCCKGKDKGEQYQAQQQPAQQAPMQQVIIQTQPVPAPPPSGAVAAPPPAGYYPAVPKA